jgi:hypothetical protein
VEISGVGVCCMPVLELDVSPLLVEAFTADVPLGTLQITCRMPGPFNPASSSVSMFMFWHTERRLEEVPSFCKSFKPSKGFCISKDACVKFENSCIPIAVSHLQV